MQRSNDVCFKVVWYYQLSCLPTLATAKNFKADVSSVSPSSSLWRRANARNVSFETLYVSRSTLSTQLIIPNYLLILSHRRSTTVWIETYHPAFIQMFFSVARLLITDMDTHYRPILTLTDRKSSGRTKSSNLSCRRIRRQLLIGACRSTVWSKCNEHARLLKKGLLTG